MKFKHLLPLLVAAMTLGGCEERIDERFRPVPPVEPLRTVLIEEFTSTDCPDSPAGHDRTKAIEQLFNTPANLQNGVGVIAVAIHIPDCGRGDDHDAYVTPEAEAMAGRQASAPTARINRHTNTLNPDRWLNSVNKEIGRPTRLTFNPIGAFITSKGIEISGSMFCDVAIDNARLHVWLVEDNITAPQLTPDGYASDYLHQGVYRSSVTGLRGAEIFVKRNENTDFKFGPYPLNPEWNADNLRVVVFATTPEQGVINAAQTPVQHLQNR